MLGAVRCLCALRWPLLRWATRREYQTGRLLRAASRACRATSYAAAKPPPHPAAHLGCRYARCRLRWPPLRRQSSEPWARGGRACMQCRSARLKLGCTRSVLSFGYLLFCSWLVVFVLLIVLSLDCQKTAQVYMKLKAPKKRNKVAELRSIEASQSEEGE